MGRKKAANCDVVKFFPVISLKSVYGAAELGGDIGVKCSEGGSDVRLFAKWKSPNQNESSHREEQDNTETQNYLQQERSIQHCELTEKEKTQLWKRN
jgi:hypothetical protein